MKVRWWQPGGSDQGCPPYTLVGGVPAKVIGKRNEDLDMSLMVVDIYRFINNEK